jgi:hypothetical protein
MLLLGTPVGLTAPPNTVDGVHFHVGSTTCNPGVCPQLAGNRIPDAWISVRWASNMTAMQWDCLQDRRNTRWLGFNKGQSLMGNDRSGSRSLLVSTALIGRVALASSIACCHDIMRIDAATIAVPRIIDSGTAVPNAQ